MAKLDAYEPRKGDVLTFVPKSGQPATFEVVDDSGRLRAPAFVAGKRYPAMDGQFHILDWMETTPQGTLYLASTAGLQEIGRVKIREGVE